MSNNRSLGEIRVEIFRCAAKGGQSIAQNLCCLLDELEQAAITEGVNKGAIIAHNINPSTRVPFIKCDCITKKETKNEINT